MNLLIENRDPDCPDTTREIAEVAFDLEADQIEVEPPSITPAAFAGAIEAAAAADNQPLHTTRAAKARLHSRIRAATDAFSEETGLSVTRPAVRVYKPKPRAAYELWKRVGQAFLYHPETLDMKPADLAAHLNSGGDAFAVTPPMIHAKLGRHAARGLQALLADAGFKLVLAPSASLRAVQNQLAGLHAKRTQRPTQEFMARVVIDGDACHINGLPFSIQLGASGERRIRFAGRWLPLDVLQAVCAARA